MGDADGLYGQKSSQEDSCSYHSLSKKVFVHHHFHMPHPPPLVPSAPSPAWVWSGPHWSLETRHSFLVIKQTKMLLFKLCSMPMELTMAQSTVVPSAPCIEFAISSNRSAVCAPTGNVYHMLSCLLPIEGCNHCRLL